MDFSTAITDLYPDLDNGPYFLMLVSIFGRQGNTLLWQWHAPAYFPSVRKNYNGCAHTWAHPTLKPDPPNPMKTKQTTALMMSAMLITALIGNGKPIPISIDGTIPFSRSSKNKDTNFEDAANFINFGTVKGQNARTVSAVSKTTEKAAVIVKSSPRNNVKASAPTKPLKISKSRGKKNTLQLGSPGVDSLSPSSWVLSGFGTALISGPVLNNQQTSGLETLTGQTPAEPSFTLAPPTIVSYPATQSVQSVPDGGATALLLGLSICGFGWLKRKSAA